MTIITTIHLWYPNYTVSPYLDIQTLGQKAKTTEHIIKLVKDGFYDNTQVVFDNSGSYLILGSYTLENNKYKDVIVDDSKKVEGEFFKNGASGIGVGSGIIDTKAVKAGDWEKVTNLAKAFTSQIN